MNDARFTGNLTKNPEARVMSNGKLRCTFTLAVTRPYTNQQGTRDADFIQFIAFDKTAELAEKYLTKGRKVLVVSHVKTGSYEKDEGSGEKRRVYTTEFIVDKLEFLSAAQQEEAPAPPQQGAGADEQGFEPADDEELPF